MARVELVTQIMPALLPMQGRHATNIHVSEIVNDMCVRLGKYAPREEFNQSQLELGNAFEHAIIARMRADNPDRYFDLGELELDGISGTPDLGDLDENAIDEMKCTWMSTKWGPGSDKFFKYELQIKSYAHMAEFGRAYLNVLFVNGDYTYGKDKDGRLKGPSEFRRWRYDYTVAELTQHWRVMLLHAEGMKRARDLAAKSIKSKKGK